EMAQINDQYSYLIDDRVYKVVESSKIQNATSLQGLYLRSYVLRKDSTDLESLYAQREIISEAIDLIDDLFVDDEMIKEIEHIK
ncbi:hypothetical protein R2R70_21910, partial [Cobetia sp. SIMBA_158]|uniref:hypothetical protein n=1 Tax=Cobetia sp. SIMBA_158 TaxID=3081617 RepID=UPI003980EA54